MSLADRCDEIVRLINEVLGDGPEPHPDSAQRAHRGRSLAGGHAERTAGHS
jgi:hypothetical protein